ncbi:hypothetical protein [Methylomonas sp. HYX-M1]|uniref:hypothetical protein n=1 Tax=Methylomonas sp. HYX-M1 TaxID=3139307 RepID=UPI00345BF8B5
MPDHEITIDLPEPHYTLFNSKRDGLPEVIVVNDALLAFQHTAIFPWHLCITIEAEELIENGMPSEKGEQTPVRSGRRDRIRCSQGANRTRS